MDVPQLWEGAGLPGYDGIVWFRKTFDLPAGWTGQDVTLNLAMIDDSGAHAAVLLNKVDLCTDPTARIDEIRPIAAGAPVVTLSALDGPLDAIGALLPPGQTVALVGSSGVG